MRYLSTRGGISPISFQEAVLMGLATDGGLLLPERIPTVDRKLIDSWRQLSYQELAAEILALFVTDIDLRQLKKLINKSYATFTHPEITPVVRQGDVHILELFHGPTLAFKDVALQLLGNLFEYFLAASGSHMNILGATSGDTGSAAIHGVRGKERINIFILHPHQRVSPVQERQMTSVIDKNVFNIAIEGTFDDGQAIVKKIFNDLEFKERHRLGAVNSINWARILAQVVYYVFAYFKVTARESCQQVDFSIPTGNFGDIFAGYVAREMISADRIGRLVLATNQNDILARFVLQGDYSTSEVRQTSSPSMDIQLASNFERYLFYLHGSDADKTRTAMAHLSAAGSLAFTQEACRRVRQDFAALSVTESEVLATMQEFYQKTGYILDPHTAVGVHAGLVHKQQAPMICLATAHPGKFGEAVSKAIGPQPLPASLQALEGKETRCTVLPARTAAIRDYIDAHAR